MTFILNTPTETCAQLGVRARNMRLALNLTQADLASRAGVSGGAVRKLEADGQTTLATFVKCACAMGAASEFETLLAPRTMSIAQMEKNAAVLQRKRARRTTADTVLRR